MPDGNPIASLYPQPQTTPTGLASMNPLQVIGAANALTQNRVMQADLASRQATGEAYQGALNPDGSVDQSKLSASLQANPAAAFGMPETASRMLQQTSGQTDLDAARNKFIVDAVGAVADDPKITADKVRSLGVTLARNLKIPAPMINNWLDDLPKGGPALRDKLIQFRNMATGSAGASTPTQTGMTPEGAPVTGSRGQFNYATGAGGGVQTALPPGEEALRASASKRADALQATADTSIQYRADLENLRSESKILDNLGGPTYEVEKKLNQLSQRLAGMGITMTPDQLRAGESFDKIVNQLSLRQAQTFGGTDASRGMALGATPNTSMSGLGRAGVISMLQGNQDAIDTAREAWLEARSKGQSAQSFDLFMHGMGKVMDPRTFQFNRMNRDAQQRFLLMLPPSELPDFENNYRAAIHRGWVKDLKKTNE